LEGDNIEHEKFYVGLDLGFSQDYSALSLLETRTTTKIENQKILYQVDYFMSHLERFPLNTEYPIIVERVSSMFQDRRLEQNGTLIIDRTGVGEPVGQLFEKKSIQLVSIVITGGEEVVEKDPYLFHVPKRILVNSLAILSQFGRLKVTKEIPLCVTFSNELKDFAYKLDKKSGHDVYEGISGSHDDLVISTSLAAWYGMREDRHMEEQIEAGYNDDEDQGYDYLHGKPL